MVELISIGKVKDREKDVKSKKISVIVKPTHDCNLGCRYCYIDPDAEQGIMSQKTLGRMVDQLATTHEEANFIWHGGEPFTMPLEFYREAVRLQNVYSGTKFTNGFQSNGTLITDEILDFCEENDFRIGFSLDGPQKINDKTRIYKDGESCFEDILILFLYDILNLGGTCDEIFKEFFHVVYLHFCITAMLVYSICSYRRKGFLCLSRWR